MTAAYRPLLGPLQLTYPQYLVMLVLWEQVRISEEQGTKFKGMPVGDLGKKLDLDTGTLTPLLKRLEKIGYITRLRDQQDERIVRVNLTEIGADLEDSAVKMAETLRCSSGLSPQELNEIRSGVKQLLQKIPAFKHLPISK
jgi:DNA-binding MarR family transcriptional regulator